MIRFNHDAIDMLSIPRAALEELLSAPPECLRLYCYGLLREKADAEQIMAELGLAKRQLFQAIDGLAERGLLFFDGENGTELQYQPPKKKEALPASLYQDGHFNTILQAVFQDRELSYRDYQAIYECIEVYGLPKQVVLMLAEYCIGVHQMKNRVPISFLKETARQWAKAGIDTIEAATRRMQAEEAEEGVESVLRAIGISRNPTAPERALYQKWTNDWAFSHGAVLAATTATTGAREPSLKYLDGILTNLQKKGIHTAGEVTQYYNDQQRMDDRIKKIKRMMHLPKLTVSEEDRTRYFQWRKLGFGRPELEYAAQKSDGPEAMGALLARWHSQGLLRKQEILQSEKTFAARQEKVLQMMAKAGLPQKAETADFALYQKFRQEYQMPEDVILYAAGLAYGLGAPLKAMDAILSRWHAAGAHTLARAQAENAKHRAQPQKAAAPVFIERGYSQQELEQKVYDPLDDMEE